MMNTLHVDNARFLPTVASYLKRGHSVTINVKGNSMRPFIESGRDKAVLEQAKRINVGDVVLALTTDDRYVLHRVVARQGEMLTLMGDGNIRGREHCLESNVLGIAVAFIRGSHERKLTVASRTWRTYSYIWTHLLPLRRYLLWIYRKLWRLD